jgi:hypothetical protein
MTKLQRVSELPPDDKGEDKLLASDATASHRSEMLDLVEQSLDRPGLSTAERARLVEMRVYWQRSLDHRLGQLAAGAKPTSTLLPERRGNPAILAGIAAAFQLWSLLLFPAY